MNKPKPGPGGKVNTPDYYHYYYSQPLNGPSRSFAPATTPQPSQETNRPRASGRTLNLDVKAIAADIFKFTKQIVKQRIFYKVLAWLLAFWFFVRIEFGAVFVVISGFALIFLNLGDRKKGEESAYNVFNKNHRELLGTFNARQFEDQILHRNTG
eukprot:Phypoly_transcript_21395.p1 GENE.Phypoly_transcript_21395~~Phypoly_transcript_21395.p1  ORF type:complete len:182 (+),score=28.93 Phypoly_transcript_21395:83-547(+)